MQQRHTHRVGDISVARPTVAIVLLAVVTSTACREPTRPPDSRSIAVPRSVAFATTQRTIVNGVGATASLSSLVGCVSTNTTLTPLRDGSPNVIAGLHIVIIDVCSGALLDDIVGLSFTGTFTVDLDRASMNGVLTGQTALGDPIDFPVSLTWTGVGGVTKNTTVTNEIAGSTRTVVRVKSSSRNATLTGSFDSQDVAGIVAGATLLSDVYGTITITR